MITAGEIKVQSRYAVDRLSDMELDIREGCHGKLVLRGWISGTGVRTDDVIRITVPGNEDGREAVLFDGIIREAHIFLEGGVKQVILEAAAHSIRLDRQKNSRSFQDVSITYDRIVEHILSGYRGALTCGYPPLQTGIPVIQYQETDWEFCRRMAGSMGLGIFCDETAGRPAVRLGRPEGERRAVFQEDSYRCGTDESCCRRRQESGTSKAEFLYYEVLSEGNYAVGDYADCRGRKRYIFEKHAEVINGVLMFRYKLGGEAHFRKSREYNRRLAGCSLPGLAVRTEGGNVFIRLDIDGEDGQAGYPYPWRPLTGGIMYCMPRAGTRVSLYFPDCHEERAYAVNCIRTNGGRPCFSDPQSREFVTEHGRRMQLYADSICFEGGRHIFSMGEGGCVLKTAGSMQVVSGGRVRLSAPDITVKTPSGISQIKNREYAGRHGSCTGSMNPATGGDASFAMQHEFNGLAGQGILHGTEYEEYKPFDDAPGYDHPAGAKIVSGVMTALLVGAAAGL
ncbi:MAG: hypothetical protein J6D08_00290, partial [Lachnospiraceae bacterium]|nr:hypothetical protein [Lachnospiraceae bacterium]